MKIKFDVTNSQEWNTIFLSVQKEFENSPFPGDFGFRLLENISLGDYYEVVVFLLNDELRANVCRWSKGEDANRYWRNPLDRFHLNGVFIPTLIKKETILSDEEKKYFSEFVQKLLVEQEGQILERRDGLLLDGSDYVLQIFNEGKMQRVFRWNDLVRTRGLMEQVIKLTEHVRRKQE